MPRLESRHALRSASASCELRLQLYDLIVIDDVAAYNRAAEEFATSVSQMVSVRVVEGEQPHLTSKKRRHQPPVLLTEHDPSAIEELRSALELSSVSDRIALIMSGSPSVTIVGPQGDLASFTYLSGGYIRLRGDVSDAPLAHPRALEEWLNDRLGQAGAKVLS